MLITILLLVVTLLIGLNPTSLVLAQSDETFSEVILQKQRLEQQIQDTKTQLLSELSSHQQQEKKYRVALDQYKRLQTLSSIEEAVSATKNAMLSRNQVLKTYLELNRLKLIEAEGIEISHKQIVLDQLESNQEILRSFEKKLNQELNREQINQLAEEFEPIGQQLQETSYYALNLLSIGRLQAVYDQALAIYQKILEDESVEDSLIQQTERQRALNEVDKLFTQIAPLLEAQWADLEQVRTSQHSDYQRFYRSIFDDLNPIYAQLSQLTAYLEELEGIK